jgi:hypothetical protein
MRGLEELEDSKRFLDEKLNSMEIEIVWCLTCHADYRIIKHSPRSLLMATE